MTVIGQDGGALYGPGWPALSCGGGAMKLFECDACGQPLYFENTRCESCSRRLGFMPRRADLVALEPGVGEWSLHAEPGRRVRFCQNAEHDACNWLVPADGPDAFCVACRHNHVIPDLSVERYVDRWRRLEGAKRRLFYTLLKLRLPLRTRDQSPEGLAFDFLSDETETRPGAPTVLTGHDNGLITINIIEADDVERERRRRLMGEPYRTLLGHFRHEVGHHFWNVLVRDQACIDAYRALFGDEREDYGAALQRHYAEGPPPDWQERYVSSYASAHSWEDFAETWAHYLHIVDTLETANAFGVRVRPKVSRSPELTTSVEFDPHNTPDLDRLISAWLPLTFAVNSLNRSMGQPDLYPFVLSPVVISKLAFIHERIYEATDRDIPSEGEDENVLSAIAAGLRSGLVAPSGEPEP